MTEKKMQGRRSEIGRREGNALVGEENIRESKEEGEGRTGRIWGSIEERGKMKR